MRLADQIRRLNLPHPPYRTRSMATAEALMSIVGSPVDSDAVRALVATDGLTAAVEPEHYEGVPRRAYLSGQAAGYQLTHYGGRVVTAHLYAEPAEGFAPFPGTLPGNLSRGAAQAEVRSSFGTPERSSGGAAGPTPGRRAGWDRFAMDDLRIHFQYREADGHVVLVTIMAAGTAP